MPAHVKSSILGVSISVPVSGGRLALGTWQGIYLCEHRNHGGRRRLIATLPRRRTGLSAATSVRTVLLHSGVRWLVPLFPSIRPNPSTTKSTQRTKHE